MYVSLWSDDACLHIPLYNKFYDVSCNSKFKLNLPKIWNSMEIASNFPIWIQNKVLDGNKILRYQMFAEQKSFKILSRALLAFLTRKLWSLERSWINAQIAFWKDNVHDLHNCFKLRTISILLLLKKKVLQPSEILFLRKNSFQFSNFTCFVRDQIIQVTFADYDSWNLHSLSLVFANFKSWFIQKTSLVSVFVSLFLCEKPEFPFFPQKKSKMIQSKVEKEK
jgi:hypothetical protein